MHCFLNSAHVTEETDKEEKPILSNAGDVVRGFRTLCGMTRDVLGDKIGSTPSAIASWERNRTELKLSTVKDMADAFAPYGDLFWEAMMRTAKLE